MQNTEGWYASTPLFAEEQKHGWYKSTPCFVEEQNYRESHKKPSDDPLQRAALPGVLPGVHNSPNNRVRAPSSAKTEGDGNTSGANISGAAVEESSAARRRNRVSVHNSVHPVAALLVSRRPKVSLSPSVSESLGETFVAFLQANSSLPSGADVVLRFLDLVDAEFAEIAKALSPLFVELVKNDGKQLAEAAYCFGLCSRSRQCAVTGNDATTISRLEVVQDEAAGLRESLGLDADVLAAVGAAFVASLRGDHQAGLRSDGEFADKLLEKIISESAGGGHADANGVA